MQYSFFLLFNRAMRYLIFLLVLLINTSTSYSATKVDIKKLSENFQELHRVHLEITRVLRLSHEPGDEAKESLVFSLDTSGKDPLKMTPFLKIQRALDSAQGISLKKSALLKCDQYSLEIAKDQKSILILEVCQKKQKQIVAKIVFQGSRQWKVSFIPAYWTDILGLGVGIFSQEVTCQIELSVNKKIESYSCQNWVQSFSPTRVYKFKDYTYRKDQDPLIELRGELLDNYFPLRRVSLKIPLAGRIQWQESEISAVGKSTPTPTPTVAPAVNTQKPVRGPAPIMPPPGYSEQVPVSRDQELESQETQGEDSLVPSQTPNASQRQEPLNQELNGEEPQVVEQQESLNPSNQIRRRR